MRKRSLRLLSVLALVVGLVLAASPANADVERYQEGTFTWTVTVNNTYVHQFVVGYNPCGGGLTPISGNYISPGSWPENFSVTMSNGTVSIDAVYPQNGYSWGFTASYADGMISGPISSFYGPGVASVVVTGNSADMSDWANHGAFVAANSDKADAAHSCIGMPVSSNKGN